ncbi:endonuclease/exonuclease/phosphatase family protein [Kaistia soli]|nr:endonuclease/exonuclease/phosphatase family protein [Kaistia soli]
MLLVVRFLFDASLVPVAVLVLAGHFGRADWLLDMTNYFRPHIAGMALLLLLVAIMGGGWLRLAAAFLVFVAALYPLVATSLPAATTVSKGNLRLTTANVFGPNRDYARFEAMVAEIAPDILVAQEAVGAWPLHLAALPGLPFVSDLGLRYRSHVMVASRYPIKTTLIGLEPPAVPSYRTGGSLALRIEVDRPAATRPLVIYAIHPQTTRTYEGWFARNAYLHAIAKRLKAEKPGTDLIVAGDWNTPFWSPVLAEFFAASGLQTTERGSWPPPTRFFREARLPPALGTPIDRVAVSKDIGLADIHIGKPFGSDHLPVTADLAIP